MKIAIVYSLPSQRMLKTKFGETDGDTEVIAKTVKRGLMARGMQVELVPISEDLISNISHISADVIFNLIEWCGLDIDLSKQTFKEMRALNIPITGSGENEFVLTGDKIKLKDKLVEMGATTPQACFFEIGNEPVLTNFTYPVLVKPSLEHCSMGISRDSLAHTEPELKQIVKKQIREFKQGVLAEEFVKGRELLVYLIEEETGVRCLPIEEVLFSQQDGSGFQTYETKWDEESFDYKNTWVETAKLSEIEETRVKDLALLVFRELGLVGYARFDLRLKESMPYILEANANPSVYDATEELTEVESEVIEGIRFPDYLESIVGAAIKHYRLGWRV